jgi:4-amino-4-deoxy-L-arabinose transferase-like glycosyltransferase
MYAIWFPSPEISMQGVGVAVAWLMAMLAVFAIIASVKGHHVVLFIAFLASFLPVGAMLLYVRDWPRWIGVLNLVLFVASVLLWQGARRRASPP